MLKKTLWTVFVLLLVAGAFYLGYDYYKYSTYTHYHANIAIFLNWQRLDLRDDKYMEDVAVCRISEQVFPKDRVHFHNNDMNDVHVHAKGVTWWHLMWNIGFSFGKKYFIDDNDTIMIPGSWQNLVYILNGKSVDNPYNTLIKSEDRLLVYLGTWDATYALDNYYAQVATSATQRNSEPDPWTCSWSSWWLFYTIFTWYHDTFAHSH